MRSHVVAAGMLALMLSSWTSLASAASPPTLPPTEDGALQALNTSPRHGEWVDIDYIAHAPLKGWVVFPERKDKAPAVVVIHEIFGLTDWVRAVADRLAAEGFIAVAPDLISGLGPTAADGRDSTLSRDDAVKLVRWLSPEEASARIKAARDWVTTLPSANGKVGTIGFCWGGGKSFAQAATDPPPLACVVYYGTAPDSATILKVKTPVLAHYGGDDERVNATIDAAKAALKKQHVTYETHVYPGAGHGFLRQQKDRNGANQKAADESWPRTIAFLKSHVK